MDVIYPIRPGEDNDELRYSLRSLEANFPHSRVWVVGYQPSWMRRVEYIPGGNQHQKFANLYNNLRLACTHEGVSDRVAVFNDDFYITQAVEGVPASYRMTLQEHLELPRLQENPSSRWTKSMKHTQVALQAAGIANPLSYELHIPYICDRHSMADTLERFEHVTPSIPPQWRTLHGNLHRIGGERRRDAKTTRRGALREPFHSSTDTSFYRIRDQLAALFPHKSRYEQ